MTVRCPGWKTHTHTHTHTHTYIYIYIYSFDIHTSIKNVIYTEVQNFGDAMFMQKDKNVYLNFSPFAKN